MMRWVRRMWLEGNRALCLAPEEVEKRLLESAAAAEAASEAAAHALDALAPLERCAWTVHGAACDVAAGMRVRFLPSCRKGLGGVLLADTPGCCSTLSVAVAVL